MNDANLEAGFSRQIINPPKGILTIGFGDRFKGNQGVHDDLFVTALVLKDAEKAIGILGLDLLAIHEDLTAEVEARCGMSLYLCCAHTHAAPMNLVVSPLAFRVRKYQRFLVNQIVKAINDAKERCEPANFSWGVGETDIAINRRERLPDGTIEIGVNPDGPVDRRVAVLEVRSQTGHALGRLINMQCHATVMGPENLLISADWVGEMRHQVESEFGGFTLFIQGAAGDLNPRINVGNDFVHLKTIGCMAYESVKIVMGSLKPLALDSIRHDRNRIWIPLLAEAKTAHPPKTYRQIARTVGLPPFLADSVLNYLYPWRTPLEKHEGSWAFPIQANFLCLGEFALAALGMEVFTQIGMRIREKINKTGVMFASLTNSCYGYLPTETEYDRGGYEIESSWKIYRMPGPMPADADQRAAAGLLALCDKVISD